MTLATAVQQRLKQSNFTSAGVSVLMEKSLECRLQQDIGSRNLQRQRIEVWGRCFSGCLAKASEIKGD